MILDVIASLSVNTLIEGFANLTLLFGFLPDAGNIEVIGVGWFLGLIFVFYICFPFFCVLLETKSRAWMAFGISLVYNFVCISYFDVGRTNILFCACYFIAGGLIYLYRNEISLLNRWVGFGTVVTSVILYYILNENTIGCLLVSICGLSYAIICASDGQKSYALGNAFTKFISGISMEIYLSHMVIFRIVERVGLNKRFGSGWVQYTVTVVIVLVGASVFSTIMQKLIGVLNSKIEKNNSKKLMGISYEDIDD